MKNKTAKVQGIFALSTLQKALLLHHLDSDVDQGIIQISAELHGDLNLALFQKAWSKTIARHQALRTSVHWEKVAKPLAVIRPEAEMLIDYTELSEPVENEINAYRIADRSQNFDLTQVSMNRLKVFKIRPNKHHFFWTSHHILLDGWSAGIILRDVFKYYGALVNEGVIELPPLPTYKQYHNWLINQDRGESAKWWAGYFDGFKKSSTFTNGAAAGAEYGRITHRIDGGTAEKIDLIIKQQRLTLNTVAQGLWGICLAKFFGENDVLFGTTVSGRTSEIVNHDAVAGLFTNPVPVRIQVAPDQDLLSWLSQLQSENLNGLAHNYATLEEVGEWTKLPNNRIRFDHLFLIQNYPWSEIKGGGLALENFAGDITSNYPITVSLIPGDGFTLSIDYSLSDFDSEIVEWLGNGFIKLLEGFTAFDGPMVKELTDLLDSPPIRRTVEKVKNVAGNKLQKYVHAASKTELALVKIWEDLLHISPVGVNDDFFESGGTSMLAVRLFSRVEQLYDKKLAVVSILKNRTIRKLAALISEGNEEEGWSTVVPLKASGSKPGIFCFHAGMGHILFYHPFSTCVDQDRPVYAIQPNGLDGVEEVHGSIEEMSAHYLKEIKKVQPSGPYNLLGYCFSTAICVEIHHQLTAHGEPPPNILIVDSAPLPEELEKAWAFRQKKRGLRWYAANLYNQNFDKIKKTVQLDYMPTEMLPADLKVERELDLIKDKYVPLYENYIWKKVNHEVALFRSSDFASKEVRNWHLEVWTQLSANQLRVYEVETDHEKIFDKPQVAELAGKIEAYLSSVANG